jgi:vacuolar iron transporter family protein
MEITADLRQRLLAAQRNEITEYHVYKRISATLPDKGNRQVMNQIADDELSHYKVRKNYIGQEVPPKWFQVRLNTLISRVFGLTFGAKLMEMGEEKAQVNFAQMAEAIPEINQIHADEKRHEEELLDMLDE